MRDFEFSVASEFRAYLSSFIRTGDPNTAKLPLAPYWSKYGALGDFVNSPVRLVPQFAFSSNANKSYPTSTQLENRVKGRQRTNGFLAIRPYFGLNKILACGLNDSGLSGL
jgi:hypothetical protein